VVNSYLIQDLKKLGLWNGEMLDQLKYHDGRLDMIRGIPDYIKAKYQEAFDIDPVWLLKITAARGKWIDQSQSHNVFMKGVSGKQLHDIYMSAWKLGLKTTYYLRTLGASQIEKSTLDAKKFGFTQKREYGSLAGQAEKSGEEKEFEFSTDPSIPSINSGQATSTKSLIEGTFTAEVIEVSGRTGGEEASEELFSSPQACSLSTDPECDVCQ
jgi:ribonucleotide reductase alpha subunit